MCGTGNKKTMARQSRILVHWLTSLQAHRDVCFRIILPTKDISGQRWTPHWDYHDRPVGNCHQLESGEGEGCYD